MGKKTAIKKRYTTADYTPSSNDEIRIHPKLFKEEGYATFNQKGATNHWC